MGLSIIAKLDVFMKSSSKDLSPVSIRPTLPSPARKQHSELLKCVSVAGLVNGNVIRLLRRQISAVCFEQPTQSVH